VKAVSPKSELFFSTKTSLSRIMNEISIQTRERWGSRYKLPGPDYVAYIFFFIGSILICHCSY